jgi:hypothetical protein
MTATISHSTSAGRPAARPASVTEAVFGENPLRRRPRRRSPVRRRADDANSSYRLDVAARRLIRSVGTVVTGGPDTATRSPARRQTAARPTDDARPSVRLMPGWHVDPERREERRQTGCTRRVPAPAGHVCPCSARSSASGMRAMMTVNVAAQRSQLSGRGKSANSASSASHRSSAAPSNSTWSPRASSLRRLTARKSTRISPVLTLTKVPEARVVLSSSPRCPRLSQARPKSVLHTACREGSER